MGPREIQHAIQHLRKDKRLNTLVARYPKPEFDRGQRGLDPFHALIRAIIFQQLSGKVARTILNRFIAGYQGRFPTPHELLATPLSRIRSAGVSSQKAGYLKDLATKFIDGTIVPKQFSHMSDEEIHAHVVAVKGVGPWTADMFLIFTLKRPNVLPVGDLGIRKGFQKAFMLKKLPSPEHMVRLAKPWEPYRTVACWYLWRLADEGNMAR